MEILLHLEGRLVSFHLHHNMMNIDELIPDLHGTEWPLRQHLLEAVVVLDQLRQPSLSSEHVFTITVLISTIIMIGVIIRWIIIIIIIIIIIMSILLACFSM